MDDVAVSRDGRDGVLVSTIGLPLTTPDRTAFKAPVILKISPGRDEQSSFELCINRNWPAELTVICYHWNLHISDALPILATVAAGQLLDEVGAVPPGFLTRLSEVVDKINQSNPATYDEILLYLGAKVFWTWEFRRPTTSITSADLLRMKSSLVDFREVAGLREGDWWTLTSDGGLRPTSRLVDLYSNKVSTAVERHGPLPERALLAVLFVDIAESTPLAHEFEPVALRMVEYFQQQARRIVAQRGGRFVKDTGDGALAVFWSVGAAVHAGWLLLQDCSKISSDVGRPIELRIGIHMGEVMIQEDGNVLGDVVNVASRVQSAASPRQILVTEDAWYQLRRTSQFSGNDIGMQVLKGINEPIRLYDVKPIVHTGEN